MTVIRPNSITGISSIVANGSTVEFRNTAGNRITVDADITGNLTGDISGSITGNMVATQNAGIQTTTVTNAALVGVGNSFVGMYIGDGSILFNSIYLIPRYCPCNFTDCSLMSTKYQICFHDFHESS